MKRLSFLIAVSVLCFAQIVQAADLEQAVRRGDLTSIRQALESGTDINVFLSDGHTPLTLAIFQGREDVVRLLLSRGADPEKTNRQGSKPLDLSKRLSTYSPSRYRGIVAMLENPSSVPRDNTPAVQPDKKPENNASSGNSIIVYGRPGCGLCNALMGKLRQNNISYTFANIDTDRAAQQKMWDLVRQNFPGQRSVMLPIVDVNGTVMISPSLEQVRTKMN